MTAIAANSALGIVETAVRAALPADGAPPLVVGLCGAQGSGKSTIAAALADRLNADGIATVILSLDDLYLTRSERRDLASRIHTLLATRGVPGTHDIGFGENILAALDRGETIPLPSFDKAIDDRRPAASWGAAPPGVRIILFEGWCVGAHPQPDDALREPVNELERTEDREGVWRAYVNDALAAGYQRLFARIDLQILLAAPGFEIVERWRTQQEHDLRTRTGNDAAGILSDAAIRRFVRHYERLTRHILSDMPRHADLTIDLDPDRHPTGIRRAGC